MKNTDEFQQEFLSFLQAHDIVEDFIYNVEHYPLTTPVPKSFICRPINDSFNWGVSTFGMSGASALHRMYKQTYFPKDEYTATDLLKFLKSATKETPYEYW